MYNIVNKGGDGIILNGNSNGDGDILVIANPAAGGGRCARELPRLRQALERAGGRFVLRLTSEPGEAEAMAREAVGRYSAVVSAGGDGTIYETVQGLAGTDTALGVIPLGTGNDFIKTMDLPKGIEAQVEVLTKGSIRIFDLGRINDRYFANVVGIGFDAAVNRAHKDISWLSGIPSYILAIIKTLFTHGPEHVDVELTDTTGREDGSFSEDVQMLTIGNSPSCGGGFLFTPDADVEDGELDLSILHPIKNYQIIQHLPKVFKGTLQRKRPDVSTLKRFGRMKVKSRVIMPVHIDGEVYDTGRLVHEIEVVPGALRVITGRKPDN